MYTVVITVHGKEISRYDVKNISIAIAQIDYITHTSQGETHTFEMRKSSEDCSIPKSLSSGFTGTYVK